MAKASIVYTYDEHESLECSVEVDASYPDAVDEARKQATAMYADAMRHTSELNDEAKGGETE